MNEFVEECRSEWKRLGVPDPIANEMAAELAADLEQAEAEGASAEAVLGSGALHPRSFATAWAAERGVIQRPPPGGHGLPRRSRMLAAFGAFALAAIVGGVLVVIASPVDERGDAIEAIMVSPPPSDVPQTVRVVMPPAPDARIVAVEIDNSDMVTSTVGLVLLIAGLSGVVPLTMFWLWGDPGRWSPRRTRIDDAPGGPTY